MSRKRTSKRGTPSVRIESLCWRDVKASEELGHFTGELLGTTNNLMFVKEELEELVAPFEGDRHVLELRLKRLQYHVENYFIRAYALRERIRGVIESLTGEDALHRAIAALRAQSENAADAFHRLDRLLAEDIDIRNTLVHQKYPHLLLYIGTERYDATDALWHLKGDEATYQALVAGVVDAMQVVVARYGEKISELCAATSEFERATSEIQRPGTC